MRQESTSWPSARLQLAELSLSLPSCRSSFARRAQRLLLSLSLPHWRFCSPWPVWIVSAWAQKLLESLHAALPADILLVIVKEE